MEYLSTPKKITFIFVEIIPTHLHELILGSSKQKRCFNRIDISQIQVYEKVYGYLPFSYFKGPLIKIFQTDALYGCISPFITYCIKMIRRLPFWQYIHNMG